MNVKIPAGLSKAAAKCMASLQKASPEIALVSGLVGIVGTTVLACKKTRKLDDILEKHRKEMDAVRARYEADKVREKRTVKTEEDKKPVALYSDKARKKDTFKVCVNVAWDMTKLYGPVLLAEAASIGLVLLSHHQLKLKNASLSAALSSVTVAFNEYRNRVRQELGEETDRRFRYGIKSKEIERIDENGNTVKETADICELSKQDLYMRTYGPDTVQGCPKMALRNPDGSLVHDEYGNVVMVQDIEASLFEINARERFWNNVKNGRPKHRVFLNEVLLDSRLEMSDAGQDVGWAGDSVIRFRPEVVTRLDHEGRPVKTIVLDFNCDGCVRDEALKSRRGKRILSERSVATA